MAHVYLYGNFFSETSFYVLMETNKYEVGSYFSTYLDTPLIVVFVLMSIVVIISAGLMVKYYNSGDRFLFSKFNLPFLKITIDYRFLLLTTFMTFLAYSILNTTRPFYFLPFTIAKGYSHYKSDLASYQKLGNEKLGGQFTNVQHLNEKEVYVLVIGESTSRNHMGLYGYYRQTNPLLNKIKDDLIVFNDVISPNSSTIASLSKVLTLGNHENPDGRFKGSLIQLFNKAGFKTYWISAQKTSGINATFVTGISNSSDEQYFVSSYGHPPLDEELLKPLDKALNDNDNKKLIILHLLGTHASYKKRYPKSFEHFTDQPFSKFKHEKAYYYINKYDNAVLYNDYVLNKIIQKLRKQAISSSLIYFSDHGEEVYTSLNLKGHWEGNKSKPMYDIPFLIWFSKDSFKKSKNLVFDVTRKYSIENLIHTLADLAEIEFQEFEPKNSLLNANFENKNRMISSETNYDEIFISE